MNSAGFVNAKLPAKDAEEWELRPGGMLVQKRDPDAEAAHAGPIIKVKVCYGSSSQYVHINVHSTFADLKKALVQDTGLQPERQRLLYKRKERKNSASLHEAGLKNKSKVVLVEDRIGWEKKLVEMRNVEAAEKASRVVSEVQQLVDKLSGQIASIEAAVRSGKKLPDGELNSPVDILMSQSVKLDGSKVDGDAKLQKTILMRRIQKYVEKLDALKILNDSRKVQNDSRRVQNESRKVQKVRFDIQNSNGVSNARRDSTNTDSTVNTHSSPHTGRSPNNTVVTTSWETFGSSSGGANMKSVSHGNEPLLIQWD